MRPIINIETLEVHTSLSGLAKKIKCSPSNICLNIVRGCKCMGFRFEYLDEWSWWTDKEKEKWTRKNGIFFINGGKL